MLCYKFYRALYKALKEFMILDNIFNININNKIFLKYLNEYAMHWSLLINALSIFFIF